MVTFSIADFSFENWSPDDIVMLQGGNNNDVITGSSIADMIDGRLNNDTLNGGGGDDILDGYQGDDILNGESGDDTILSNYGLDTVNGGDGIDTVSFALRERRVLVDLTDTLTARDSATSGADISGIESVIGSAFSDYIRGGNSQGGAGNDLILSFPGNTGNGGAGADCFYLGEPTTIGDFNVR